MVRDEGIYPRRDVGDVQLTHRPLRGAFSLASCWGAEEEKRQETKMKLTLTQLVEDYYRNSPSWPLPDPMDYGAEANQFADDATRKTYGFYEIRSEIESFWSSEINARHNAA